MAPARYRAGAFFTLERIELDRTSQEADAPAGVDRGGFSGAASRSVLFLVLVVLAANLFWFTWSVDNGVVRHDYWRQVHLVELYNQEALTLEGLLAESNGPLLSPFTVLVPLANGLFFDFELKGLHLTATVLRCLATAVLLATLGLVPGSRRRLPTGVFCVVASVLLSPALFALLIYGQASLSMIRGSLYVLFFAVLALWLTASRPRRLHTLLVAGFAGLLIIGVAGPLSVALVAAVLATLVMSFALGLFETHRQRTAALALAAVCGVCLLLVFLFLSGPSGGGFASSALARPGPAIRFFLSMLGNSLLTTEIARMVPEGALAVIGALALAAIVFAMSISWTRVRSRALVLGWLFVGYSLAAISLTSIGRAARGTPLAARYLSDSMMWQVGLLLLLWVGLRHGARFKLSEVAGRTVLAIFAVAIVCCQGIAFHRQWEKAPSMKRALERRAAVILAADTLSDAELRRNLRETERLHKHYIRRAIGVMQEYRLNVFRRSPRKGGSVDEPEPVDTVGLRRERVDGRDDPPRLVIGEGVVHR